MIAVRLAALLALVAAQPAVADVIVPGPPIAPIELSESQIARMSASGRTAVAQIFDFSLSERPEYLNEAYRSAGKHDIARVTEVVSVKLVGDRAFVLAVTDKWLGPQTIGPVYTYFQCKFDDQARVVAVEII